MNWVAPAFQFLVNLFQQDSNWQCSSVNNHLSGWESEWIQVIYSGNSFIY